MMSFTSTDLLGRLSLYRRVNFVWSWNANTFVEIIGLLVSEVWNKSNIFQCSVCCRSGCRIVSFLFSVKFVKMHWLKLYNWASGRIKICCDLNNLKIWIMLDFRRKEILQLEIICYIQTHQIKIGSQGVRPEVLSGQYYVVDTSHCHHVIST